MALVTVEDPPLLIMGIDPGYSGGIAVLNRAGPRCLALRGTDKDVYTWMSDYGHGKYVIKAYLERVHAMPKQGVSSTFKFGQNYGMLRGYLIALGIPFEEVSPRMWCSELGLKKKSTESNTEWKNRHKAKAQELFPGAVVSHAFADAILIAEYGRRMMRA